ncbi:proteasome assembly chaperone 4-like [Sinocyclocheilus grahami]|uniref:Proteasome assembly chaperone 4-like n=1 Tax=Sinocyclocheilus grahami TaxID=75366 RepID=A0A672KE57_SINGR|nr:PREDICTED: proteasome assembly chaperone 4-like [Sinocyclocheilus grahami]
METALNGDSVGPIAVHDFWEKILEQLDHFHVMKLRCGFFLWIRSEPVLSSLALAVSSKHDSVPLSALVLGDPSDTTPSSLAQRLTKKTKKQVFVSYNLPVTNSNLALLVENRIKKEMELHPDRF